jgi:hypothetical protein
VCPSASEAAAQRGNKIGNIGVCGMQNVLCCDDSFGRSHPMYDFPMLSFDVDGFHSRMRTDDQIWISSDEIVPDAQD